MREMELVTLACGLGNFPYISFPPVAFPDPDYCSTAPVIDMEPEPMAALAELPAEPAAAEPALAEAPAEPALVAAPAEPALVTARIEPPPAIRREPILARMLPPASAPEPIAADRTAPAFTCLAELHEPVPEPAARGAIPAAAGIAFHRRPAVTPAFAS